MGRFLMQRGRPAGGKSAVESGMVQPSRWTFYFDVRGKDGRVFRAEFDVIEDRAPIDDDELGRRIRNVMDTVKERKILPAGGLPGRFGVYRGFSNLFRGRWYRHLGVEKYELDRHYTRGFGGRASAG